MKFIFKAKTEKGEMKDGLVEALDKNSAVQILQKNGLIPISVVGEKEGRPFAWLGDIQKLWEGVSQKELMVVFRQMATLLQARVPIVTSLQTIGNEVPNRYLRLVLRQLEDDIEDGMSFSEALERHPTVFDSMMVNMIKAGEISGSLQRSIEFVADNIEKNYHLTQKIRGAVLYPAFVTVVAGVIAFIVISFVLPKITALIKDLNVPVPWYTTVLMWIGDFMSAYWWAVLIVILGALGGLVYYLQTEAGKRDWNVFVLKLPVFKTLMKYLYVTRFAENLSALLDGGIPVVRALMITSDVIGNQVYAGIVLKAADHVKSGGAMSEVLGRYPEQFPPIVAQMVRIGEETGTLSGVLDNTAKFYSQEVDNITKNLTQLIEPILIVILGIGVGILVVGVLMPIYNIAGNL